MRYYYGTTPNIYKLRVLQWTTEPPTQEGLYFACSENGVEITHYRGRNETDVGIMDIEWRYPLSAFTHWIGPLPVPEPPSEDE